MLPITFNKTIDQAKAGFLDREAVLRYMDKRTAKFLVRIGGFVRQAARRSMRRASSNRVKPSAPGQAPKARTGLIRGFVLFSYDGPRRSIVVGPTALNGGNRSGDVPRLHEEGGTVTRRMWVLRDEEGKLVRFRHDPQAPAVQVRYPARPYMRPALEKGLARRDQFWRQAVGA